MISMKIKAAGMKRKEPEGDAQEKKSNKASGSEDNRSVSMQIDLAVFDCRVCFEPLKLPLFQCRNGHVICSGCCEKLQRKCPICTLTISPLRCVMLESIIESNRISCAYARNGCQELVPYNQKHIHEKSCNYGACFCPDPNCTFSGSVQTLSSHIEYQFLHVLCDNWEGDRMYLLISRRFPGGHKGFSGNALSVVCIGAGDEEDGGPQSYTLKVLGDHKAVKLTFEGVLECKREWKEGELPKCCLYVPDEICENLLIAVSICIKNSDEEYEDEVEEE